MSTNKPAISIVTPVWNGLPYIKECVDSVLQQEFQDWELVISDNCSTDKTRDYLDTLTDPRIRVYKQEKNLGIVGNLNFLFTKALAPVAHMLCADDYFYPGGLGLIMKEWETLPADTAFLSSNWKTIIDHSITSRYSYYALPKRLDPKTSQLAFFLFGNFVGNLSNMTCNVEMVRESGAFKEGYKMAGDFEIWARIARTKSMALSDAETVYVRRHEQTATNYMNKRGVLFEEHLMIYEKLVDHLSTYMDRKKLLNYFNLETNSFHFRHAIKCMFFGDFVSMKMYLSNKSPICWPTWKRFFFLLPFALYETGRMHVLVSLARKLMYEESGIGTFVKVNN